MYVSACVRNYVECLNFYYISTTIFIFYVSVSFSDVRGVSKKYVQSKKSHKREMWENMMLYFLKIAILSTLVILAKRYI